MKYLLILFAILFAACSDEDAFATAIETSEDEHDETIWNCYNKETYNYSCCSNYNITCENPEYTRSECNSGYGTDTYCCSNYKLRCSSYTRSECNSGYGTDTYCCSNYNLRCSQYECNLGYGTDTYCCSYYSVRCPSSSSNGYTYSEYECNLGYGTDANCCSYYSVRCKSTYTTTSKTMKFTLTKYKQLTSNWDGLDNAGDPKISFSVKFYNESSTLLSTKYTGTLLSRTDVRSWSGTSSTTLTVPINTYKIKVCPEVVDVDVTFDDDKSSGYCYSVTSVGLLDDYYPEEQNDSYSSDYYLYWNWYLY